MAVSVAAELSSINYRETAITMTPSDSGRFEVYLDGKKLYDRKEAGAVDFLPDSRRSTRSGTPSKRYSPRRRPPPEGVARRATMTFGTHHVHVKTRDPKQTMQFYVDNLGATLIAEVGTRGYRVNLHGLTLNISTLIDTQTREQHYGLEHIALDTDDYPGTLARLRANGVRILEELPPTNGRRVCFLEAPDGVQIEVIEKA